MAQHLKKHEKENSTTDTKRGDDWDWEALMNYSLFQQDTETPITTSFLCLALVVGKWARLRFGGGGAWWGSEENNKDGPSLYLLRQWGPFHIPDVVKPTGLGCGANVHILRPAQVLLPLGG